MFCKWCGKKVTNVGSPCPSCGKNQDPLENGNGFWDLCSKEAVVQSVDAGTSFVIPVKDSETEKNTKKNRDSRPSEMRKTAKKLWIGVWAATVTLLLIAIIVIGVGKIDLCLSEISDLRSSLCSTNTLVINGFAKLDEYHLVEEVPETQAPEETEPVVDESTPIGPDGLIEENVLIVDNEALNIESYMIESTPAKCVYIVAGEVLANENVKIFWQKSVDQGENWETIAEDVSYIVEAVNKIAEYRVVCAVADDSEAVILYCAAPTESEDDFAG